nr:ctenidin-1-like isoform X1 [Procambarus clarkii]
MQLGSYLVHCNLYWSSQRRCRFIESMRHFVVLAALVLAVCVLAPSHAQRPKYPGVGGIGVGGIQGGGLHGGKGGSLIGGIGPGGVGIGHGGVGGGIIGGGIKPGGLGIGHGGVGIGHGGVGGGIIGGGIKPGGLGIGHGGVGIGHGGVGGGIIGGGIKPGGLGIGHGGGVNPLLGQSLAGLSFGQGFFTPQNFPNYVRGYNQLYINNPGDGYGGCRYWCKSYYQNQYYCCSQRLSGR